ncbi:MAG: hypothetical protein WBX07_05985, partial [Rhodoplanes sp.]
MDDEAARPVGAFFVELVALEDELRGSQKIKEATRTRQALIAGSLGAGETPMPIGALAACAGPKKASSGAWRAGLGTHSLAAGRTYCFAMPARSMTSDQRRISRLSRS